MRIAVVDGQGGGIGRAIVEKIKLEMPREEVLALGTNSVATGQMLRAGADDGATGENAIVHNMKYIDIVVGVIAIINANSMLGELSPKMACAIGESRAFKVLLPINRCNIHVVSVEEQPLGVHIDNAVRAIKDYVMKMEGKQLSI
ncbi:DUF3842 family protein [Sinanaerobacter chloroacetimidivorans]|uniref:DUF3842 family protein n=1 Tax=Sinanaerobacter chloroacetimidivorans TaxID=2818044 RepID=A0A8J7VY71_9FIRM|nr:DUF3842 family protein [Sinanaerobacter chloroacetimidivorans]MBR0596871.1 DUF3842 family protein [Sinanaerobacter chloroacetimidivorans]